ncbi:MAG: polyphosphate kinase 1 [Cytophagales bacterium]|nr:polyphosphate kinase 1 [Cytophagales bacterium]
MSYFIHRDLSWMNFNTRVLDQAERNSFNLSEQIRFLSISSRNMDEFFIVRVGFLYHHYLDRNKEKKDSSGLRPEELKDLVLDKAQAFFTRQQNIFTEHILTALHKKGVNILPYESLKTIEPPSLKKYLKEISSNLRIHEWTEKDPLPALPSHRLILFVPNPKEKHFFLVLPRKIPRFYALEKSSSSQNLQLIPTESILKAYLSSLIPALKHAQLSETMLFRILRNADFTLNSLDDDTEEISTLDRLERKVEKRKTGRIVRMEYLSSFSDSALVLFKRVFQIENKNVFRIQTPICIDSISLSALGAYLPPLTSPHIGSSPSPNINFFEKLKEEDILLYHPYESFEWVLKFLEQAVKDPKVESIKMTIYRLSPHSKIVDLLLLAAEKGKQVWVLFEIKARFDEVQNIRYAQSLKRAGCTVLYGYQGFKVHAKLLLISRKEKEKTLSYVHIGTGNYNESTSKTYADISLITCQEDYTQDVTEVFEALQRQRVKPKKSYQRLLVPLYHMKDAILQKIKGEIENTRQGLPSGIVIKVNALQDEEIIHALYQASQAGVPIRLIVRSICCLIPGIRGLSENISARSLVGKHLEHARILYFHQNGKPQIYFGSSDFMYRSFHRRLEVMAEIREPLHKEKIINILNTQLKDDTNSYLMHPNGDFEPVKTSATSPTDAHRFNPINPPHEDTIIDPSKKNIFSFA